MNRILFSSLLIICLLSSRVSKAQWITIPDQNFASWLQNNGFATCMIGNQLNSSDSLVLNTTILNCDSSTINNLDGIEAFVNLKELDCSYNNLISLSNLPPGLVTLNCFWNNIETIDSLPLTLKFLNCNKNNFVSGVFSQYLPPVLESFQCSHCKLAELPALPSSLLTLYCPANYLDSLGTLPDSLRILDVGSNLIQSLPVLPSRLTTLQCSYNLITELPAIPKTVRSLLCYHNSLYELPDLPDTLLSFNMSDNPDIVCLPEVHFINWFYWSNTGLTCFPNIINVNTSFPSINTLPVCDYINQNNCSIYWSIKGKVYLDYNNNCNADSMEIGCGRVKLKVYQNGILSQQVISRGSGEYQCYVPQGNYAYSVDTTGMPYGVVCPVTNQYLDTITAYYPTVYGRDFALECKQGFDIGVQAIVNLTGGFRPANESIISISAGDLSKFSGLNCANGVGGRVRVIIQGPANYTGVIPSALHPSVIGDTLDYIIPDFGQLNLQNEILFKLFTDTLAQIGEQVCISVLVNPLVGDYNIYNNAESRCFNVVNSCDPNDKQVSPAGLIDSTKEWLTYTIRFQNTGNAPALHIYVLDTLDSNIDESSFQLLAYSHEPFVQIIGNVVKFNFPNINLADSVSNEPDSHGYIQYRVKRQAGLPVGTQIRNTAYIYFDFNAPVVTNTTVNEITTATTIGVSALSGGFNFNLYPNPISYGSVLHLSTPSINTGSAMVRIIEIGGRVVYSKELNFSGSQVQVDLPVITPGIYICELLLNGSGTRKKLVVTQ